MQTTLPYMVAALVAIMITSGAFYSTYRLGYKAKEAELLNEQNTAALNAMKKIQSTFDTYDKLVAEIETHPANNNVPALISSTIDKLPNPSTHK